MLLSDLSKLLVQLAERGGPFGSEGERSLRILAQALGQRGQSEVDELLKLLKPKAVRQPKAATEPSVVVERYLSDFVACDSSAKAEAVLDNMSADKEMKKPETVAVAQLFTGSKKAFKTKQAAQDAIRERIRREAWDAGALQIIRSRAAR